MKCRECAEARRFADGAVFCVMYGLIINENHDCNRKGGRLRERDDGDAGDDQGIGPEAEI